MKTRTVLHLLALSISVQLGIARQVDTVTIIHVNDTHSNLASIGPRWSDLKGSLGGIARAVSLIGLQKMSNPNPLLLHAGDAFIGDLFYNAYFGVPELQIMKGLGFHAMAVGNHEFDLTPAALHGAWKVAFADGGFPLLSANLILDHPAVDSLKQYIKPYTIVQFGNVKVGIFGMTTPSTNLISQPSPAVVDTNIIEKAAAMVDTLTARGCQVIICLSHMGFTLDALVATYVPGIHGIVGGHDHYLFPDPIFAQNVAGDSTWVVQASSYYLNVGRLRMTVSGSTVRFLDYQMIPVADPIPEEPTTAAIVNQLITGIEAEYGQPFYTQQVAVVQEYLEEFDQFPLDYGVKDTPLGNLITDAFRAYTGAAIGIEPNGSIAQPLYNGPIVAADVYRAVGYGFNTDNYLGYRLATFDITGGALLAGLEYGLATLHFNDDFLVQVSGMSYVYDPKKPQGQRVVSVKVGGNQINLSATYRVATNEFVPLFLGFIGIPMDSVRVYTGVSEFEVLLGYIMQMSSVTASVQGRVRADSIDRTTSVALVEDGIPATYELHQNYPNPFNPSTKIQFIVPGSQLTVLKVYNVLGQEVATLVNEVVKPGSYEVTWNATSYPSGVYFYRMQARGYVQTKRLVLIK